MNFIELFSENIWNLLGLIGFIIGILSYADGRSAKKQAEEEKELNRYINKTAMQNMKKEITETEIEELESQKTGLQDIIDNKLPLEAKRKDIISKIDIYKKQILSNYIEYEKLSLELDDMPQNDIPPNILEIINNKIMPEAIKKKNSERSMVVLALLFIAYLFSGSIPIIENLRILFLVFAYKPLVNIIENYFEDYYKDIKNKIIIITNISLSLYVLIVVYLVYFSSLSFNSTSRGLITVYIKSNSSPLLFLIIILLSFLWLATFTIFLINNLMADYRAKYPKSNVLTNNKRKMVIKIISIVLLLAFGIVAFSLCRVRYIDYTYEITRSDYFTYHIAFAAICIAIGLIITTLLSHFKKNEVEYSD